MDSPSVIQYALTCGILCSINRQTAIVFKMGQLARDISVADELTRYAVDLLLATHPDSAQAGAFVKKYVRYGASPRGVQALMLAAKINAILDNRFNVSREDLQTVAPMVLRHRIILNFEGQAEGISTDQIVGKIG